MKIEYNDFASLVETRVLLETESVRLAAKRRTDEDIEVIREAFEAFAYKATLNQQSVEEDLMFHLKIANASKNGVLKSLMLTITPDIINSYIRLDICKDERMAIVLAEHKTIINHIVAQEPTKAASAMRSHLKWVLDYSKRLRNKNRNGLNGNY